MGLDWIMSTKTEYLEAYRGKNVGLILTMNGHLDEANECYGEECYLTDHNIINIRNALEKIKKKGYSDKTYLEVTTTAEEEKEVVEEALEFLEKALIDTGKEIHCSY